jgi:hypothetical protein
LDVLRDLIGNTICADLLDYIHRDLHHLGKHKQFDMRLIDYLEIRKHAHEGSALVVFMRNKDRLRTDAISAILDLLEARYQLFEMALYHRVKLSASAMLERVAAEIAHAVESGRGAMGGQPVGDDYPKTWYEQLTEELLECSDAEMLQLLQEHAKRTADDSQGLARQRLRAGAETITALRQRRLHKQLYRGFTGDIGESEAQSAQRIYAHGDYTNAAGQVERDSREAANNRLLAMRQLEEDFGLDPLSLVMYCPPGDMSTKIANVAILFNDHERTLDDDEDRQTNLTGGHLKAQKLRFARLWQVYVACERDQLARIEADGLRVTLINAIECFVLGHSGPQVSLHDRAQEIARTLTRSGVSRWEGRHVRSVEDARQDMAARGDSDGPLKYPTGLPALRSLIVGQGA